MWNAGDTVNLYQNTVWVGVGTIDRILKASTGETVLVVDEVYYVDCGIYARNLYSQYLIYILPINTSHDDIKQRMDHILWLLNHMDQTIHRCSDETIAHVVELLKHDT